MGGRSPKTNGKNLAKKKPGFRRARGYSGLWSSTVSATAISTTLAMSIPANVSMIFSGLAGLAPGSWLFGVLYQHCDDDCSDDDSNDK